jgi:putative transcriptional regulator
MLAAITDPMAWLDRGVPGMRVARARAGPALRGARVCFLEAAPSARHPLHRHVGEERVLLLEGGFRLDDGREVHAGDLVVSASGSMHAFTVFADGRCVGAYVMHGDIEIVGP